MAIDPANPVAILCARGMESETTGDFEQAHRFFQAAWEASTSPYEAAIAAHFVARNQPTVEAALEWNRLALDRAMAAPAEEVREFFASLHLNLAASCLLAGLYDQARQHLALGRERLLDLPPGPYTDTVRMGLDRLGQRLDGSH